VTSQSSEKDVLSVADEKTTDASRQLSQPSDAQSRSPVIRESIMSDAPASQNSKKSSDNDGAEENEDSKEGMSPQGGEESVSGSEGRSRDSQSLDGSSVSDGSEAATAKRRRTRRKAGRSLMHRESRPRQKPAPTPTNSDTTTTTPVTQSSVDDESSEVRQVRRSKRRRPSPENAKEGASVGRSKRGLVTKEHTDNGESSDGTEGDDKKDEGDGGIVNEKEAAKRGKALAKKRRKAKHAKTRKVAVDTSQPRKRPLRRSARRAKD